MRIKVTREQLAKLGVTPTPSPKGNKFRNTVTVLDGVRFDSAKEARRWAELQLLERCGAISDLRRQVRFPLVVNGETVCVYVADAVYTDGGKQVVEDVKSAHTRKLPVYRLKAKLMAAVYGIEIREV